MAEHKISPTHRPDETITVDDQELLDLSRMGFVKKSDAVSAPTDDKNKEKSQ